MRNSSWPLVILTCALAQLRSIQPINCHRLSLGHLARNYPQHGRFFDAAAAAAAAAKGHKFVEPVFCGHINGQDYGAMMAAIIVTRRSDPPASWQEMRENWFPTWGALIGSRKVLVPATYLEQAVRNGDHLINVELNNGEQKLRNVSLDKITRSYYNLVLTLDRPAQFNISSADSSVNRICVDARMKPVGARDVYIVSPASSRRAHVIACAEVAGRRPEKLVCVSRTTPNGATQEPKLGHMLAAKSRDRYWLLGLYSPPVGRSQGSNVWAFNGVGEIGESEPWRMY